MKKKLLITSIAVCAMLFVFGMINASAASSGTCGDNLTWTLDDEGTLIIDGQGDMDASSYNGVAPWSSSRNEITKVLIEDGVTSIGWNAFSNCSNLVSITIPNSVTNIGTHAFYNCSGLVSITIPNSVTSIGDKAFYNCASLKKVNITDVGAWCNIKFYSNDSALWESNPLYYARELYLNDELVTNLIIPDSVSAISSYLFYMCKSLESITIPDSVTTIGTYAFSNCRALRSVIIGDSVTSIGSGAFRNCVELANISLSDNVSTLGNESFYSCTSLTSITIPNSVNSIGKHAFYNCSSLTDVYYNGTQGDWNEITIGAYNSNLKDAQRHYFLYVTYINENGEIIFEDMATSNTTIIFVVLPDLFANEWYEAKFYIDEAYTTEFNPSIQIVENTTLYVKALKKQMPYTINSVTIKDMSGNNLQAIPTGTFLASISFTNISSSEDAVIILAQYTDVGAFKGLMYIQSEDVPTGSTIKLAIPVDNSDGDIAKFKAFCLESFGSLTPMGNSVSFPID